MLSSEYQDKWHRWHYKPCEDGKPSSNNGWLDTAVAMKLGLPVYYPGISECFQACWEGQEYFMNRTPRDPEPPMSRDEILGLKYLRLLGFFSGDDVNIILSDIKGVRTIETKAWNFCPYKIPPFSFSLTLVQAMVVIFSRTFISLSEKFPKLFDGVGDEDYQEMKKIAHRNSIWNYSGEFNEYRNDGLSQLWRFAFSTPLSDRAFILRESANITPRYYFYSFYEWVSNLIPPSDSSKILRWLKGGSLPKLGVWIKIYGEDHPFVKKVKEINV